MGFHKCSFRKGSDIQYFKNNNFLTKIKKPLLYWLWWRQKRILSLKLPDDWQILRSKIIIFLKGKSYEISITDIHVGEDVEFIICVFSWSIPLDHEIYTKWKKTKHLANLIKVFSSYNICSGNKSQQAQKQPFVTQNQKLLFFSEFFCSISSTNFLPFNFMCALHR